MPEFYLSQDNISRLQHKFNLFNKERRIIHELLINYEADYRQFKGKAKARREFLREKYLAKAPNMSHLILNNKEVLWSMDDISILLGRNLSTIMRTFNKLESSSDYYSRLLALRECVKAKNGHDIFVYHKEIFDLIIDLYEDEYLLRFAKPRRGDINNAPDFKEVKKFWQYLKEQNNFNKNNLISVTMTDISAMNLKDILALIWHKVFNIKTGTVCSVIFAVCFELARKFFGVNLWLASIPFIIFIICIILIKFKIYRPDFLSDLGAGALLFALLWISGSLSVDRLNVIQNADAAPAVIKAKKLTPKETVLADKYPWVLFVNQSNMDGTIRLKVNNIILEHYGKACVQDVMYTTGDGEPDTSANIAYRNDPHTQNSVFDYWTIKEYPVDSIEPNTTMTVKSYVIFKDGSSSDIRTCEFINYAR